MLRGFRDVERTEKSVAPGSFFTKLTHEHTPDCGVVPGMALRRQGWKTSKNHPYGARRRGCGGGSALVDQLPAVVERKRTCVLAAGRGVAHQAPTGGQGMQSEAGRLQHPRRRRVRRQTQSLGQSLVRRNRGRSQRRLPSCKSPTGELQCHHSVTIGKWYVSSGCERYFV